MMYVFFITRTLPRALYDYIDIYTCTSSSNRVTVATCELAIGVAIELHSIVPGSRKINRDVMAINIR